MSDNLCFSELRSEIPDLRLDNFTIEESRAGARGFPHELKGNWTMAKWTPFPPRKQPTKEDADAARRLEQQRSRDVQHEQQDQDQGAPQRRAPDYEPLRPGRRDHAHE